MSWNTDVHVGSVIVFCFFYQNLEKTTTKTLDPLKCLNYLDSIPIVLLNLN